MYRIDIRIVINLKMRASLGYSWTTPHPHFRSRSRGSRASSAAAPWLEQVLTVGATFVVQDGGMEDVLAQVLALAGFAPQWREVLADVGIDDVTSPSLLYATNKGFAHQTGMHQLEARQFLEVAWLVHMAGGIEQWRSIVACAGAAEDIAAARFELTLALPQLDHWTRSCVTHAREQLRSPGNRNAYLAWMTLVNGCASCPLAGSLREAVTGCERAVRRVLVWRVQLSVGWVDREAFLVALECAYGKPLEETFLECIMHTYCKAIAQQFPSAFFYSMDKKRRPKKLHELGELSPPPGLEASESESSDGCTGAWSAQVCKDTWSWGDEEETSIGASSDEPAYSQAAGAKSLAPVSCTLEQPSAEENSTETWATWKRTNRGSRGGRTKRGGHGHSKSWGAPLQRQPVTRVDTLAQGGADVEPVGEKTALTRTRRGCRGGRRVARIANPAADAPMVARATPSAEALVENADEAPPQLLVM